MRINVLTTNDCPNSRAFNCPLLAARPFFTRRKMTLRFHFRNYHRPQHGDVLFINSRIFKKDWQAGREDAILQTLEQARKSGQRILWFDTTDSTWCTQLQVLPYVDHFLKSQLLVDRDRYLNPFRTGRIYTDYFDQLYRCNEPVESYPPADPAHLHKLDISWNTCFENYLETRYCLTARIKQTLRPIYSYWLDETLAIDFTPPKLHRQRHFSCRIGLTHSRPAVTAHRQAVIERMTHRRIDCRKVSLPEYFTELRQSLVGIGPFGVGEITLRDFEIIICGAALVKPDMAHLQTWPDLFRTGITYHPHQWDLSDFDSILDALAADPERCRETAENAQAIYREAVSPHGLEILAERLIAKM